MNKSEYKYFGTISFMFLFSVATLIYLFRKYALLIFQHLVNGCQLLVATLFSSSTYFIGLLLVALTFLTACIFCSKSFFSVVKTSRKINYLMSFRTGIIPSKLRKIVDQLNLGVDKVVVIKKQASYAFSYGIRSQRVVLSTGLIRRLTPKQLEAVVLHEAHHLQNKHSLLLVLSEVVSSTIFFIPLAKELNRKMRVVFEEQADDFAALIQGNFVHLNKAILKVPDSRIQIYPGFAQRGSYEISRASIVVSLIVCAFALFLYFFPAQTRAAGEFTFTSTAKACGNNQCVTNCPTDKMSKKPIMSSNLQHQLSLHHY